MADDRATPTVTDLSVPAADAQLEKTSYDAPAGGAGAVISTFAGGMREVGLGRSFKLLRKLNQEGGFDCPGCAWPDPKDRSTFEFCENGAKAVHEEGTTKKVGPAFFAQHSIDRLLTWTEHDLGKAGRLTHPMVRERGASHYTPISWDEAFSRIAEHIAALDGPDDAMFYTSGRCSNEAAFLYQLFVRQLGTNNLPDCSNLCHESSGKGLGAVLGSGKGSVTLEDFPKADLVLIFGQNPGTNHPRMMTALQEAKRAGATIVAINPLKERGLQRFSHPQEPWTWLGDGTQLADHYLQVRINGDLALIKGICKAVFELAADDDSALDRAFIEAHTSSFESFEADIEQASWEDIERSSGIERDVINRVAAAYVGSEATIACWAMGLTQHENAVATIQGVVNLLLLRGNIGKPGAGPCPVRGHSNVQGDRTMGIWEAPSEAFLDRLAEEFSFEPPREHGLAAVDATVAMHEHPGKVFFALGGNFLSANADTVYTGEALQRCRLTVQVSTKLNRSHLVTGEEALILPCLGRTDVDVQGGQRQIVSVENSQGYVHTSRGFLDPPSEECRSEVQIVAGLATAVLGERATVDFEALASDYARIREHIGRVVPGHEEYNERLQRDGGFMLPHPNRERRFPTSDGKAQFTVAPIPDERLEDGQLMLMTMRSHDQYNTTIYGYDDRYRGLKGTRHILLMHPEDMAERNIDEGDAIDLTSHHNGKTREAAGFIAVAYDLPRRCCGAYFPEANVLVPIDSYAAISKTPASKSVVITVRPAAR